MREIKFRVFTEEGVKPVESLRLGKGVSAYVDKYLSVVNPKTLMQYTGLKDKNGKELYEGDIVELTYWWFDGNEAESLLTGTVVYIAERASFGIEGVKNAEWLRHIGGSEDSDTLAFADIHYNPDDLEIVGNKYEN